MPPKASKKKKNITENTAEDGIGGAKKTFQKTVRRRGRRNSCKETQMGAGTSQTQDLIDVPSLLHVKAFPFLWHPIQVQQTLLNTEEPDPRRTCPICSSLLWPVLDTAGLTLPLLACSQCPADQLLCEQCLYPCSYIPGKSTTTCTNKSCHLVAALLSCDLVTDPNSNVKGCPQFRACPKCHSLMMHERGCKYVVCTQCSHTFCFICLRRKEECTMGTVYWSLTCSKPRAARQRFQT